LSSSISSRIRIFTLFVLLFALSLAARAADLTVRVTDPSSAAVNQARVTVFTPEGSTLSVQLTSNYGTAIFRNLNAGTYRVEVLARGFAARTMKAKVPQTETLDVQLAVNSVTQTVEVIATGTPVTNEDAAASTSQLGINQLRLVEPMAAADAMQYLPGAIVSEAGRHGGLASLFVRGGDSRYNKVIIDDVPVNEPGGTYDFGTVPMEEIGQLEFLRGAESTLYGSDAMTSVVELSSCNGSTRTPEVRLGADGGTFDTARGYASFSGAQGRLDYNLFGEQDNTNGQGVNDAYSNSAQGGNIGVRLAPSVFLRFRARHSNSRTGVQSFWDFNGQPLIPPDTDQYARQNNFLASTELTFSTGSRWVHRLVGFEYNQKRANVDSFEDPGRANAYGSFDTPFADYAHINRAGLDYQADYSARDWSRTTFGYHFEDENGFFFDPVYPTFTHGLRRNHALFAQQIFTFGRASLIGGLRYEHNESFGDKAIPRIAGSYLLLRGGQTLSGTRLRASYSTGIKAPTFFESFGIGGFNIDPNPNLKPEQNRAWEAGVEQSMFAGRVSASAVYFNNQFTNQIDFETINYTTFESKYVNINRSMDHGAELILRAQASSHLHIESGYTYLSSQLLDVPLCGDYCNPLKAPGAPFVRRPKHSGTLLATWTGPRWGASVGGTFVGRRPDSDFMGLQPPVTYAAGYARVDLGFWRAITPRITAYANVYNALNRHYEEVAGYPALRANFRAGMRFRLGGE
jgi:vitamin B12 transporter